MLDVGGYYKNVFTLAPSFDITEEEIDLGVELLEQLIRRCAPDRLACDPVVPMLTGSSSSRSASRCAPNPNARRAPRTHSRLGAGSDAARAIQAHAAGRGRAVALLSRAVSSARHRRAADRIRRSSAISTRPARICGARRRRVPRRAGPTPHSRRPARRHPCRNASFSPGAKSPTWDVLARCGSTCWACAGATAS